MNSKIPKNNLKERMLKLGYNPDLIKITPPVLDNSKIIKHVDQTQVYKEINSEHSHNFKAAALNIEDWSDFEDED